MVRTMTHVALIAAAAVAAGAALLVGCGGEDAGSARVTAAPSVTRAAADVTATSSPATAVPAQTVAPEPTAIASAPSATPGSASVPSPAVPQPTATPPAPSGLTIVIAAQSAHFVPVSASAPLGARVTLVFNNDDAGVAHDLVLYDPGRGRVGATSIFNGPGMELFSFDAAVAGRYPYACTVHRGMGGALTVE